MSHTSSRRRLLAGVAHPPEPETPVPTPGASCMPDGVLTLPLAEAERISGLSRTTLYRALGAGHLRAVKAGTRTLLDAETLRAYLAALPPAKITTRPRKHAV